MLVNAPEVLDSLKRLPPGDWEQGLAKVAHAGALYNATYGALKTAASPLFAAVNPLRDLATAVGVADPRVSRKEFAKSLGYGPEVWKVALLNATKPWHGKDVQSEAIDNAATISRRGLFGLKAQRRDPSINIDPNMLQKLNQQRQKRFGFEEGDITNIATVWSKLGEDVTRLAIYDAAMRSPRMFESVGKLTGTSAGAVKAAVEKGRKGQPTTPQEKVLIDYMQAESGIAGKTGTTNFEPKGKVSGALNALFVFNNAVQRGLHTYINAMGLTNLRGGENVVERFKRGNRFAQYGTLTATVLGALNAAYNLSNDEDGKYEQMSDQQQDKWFSFGNSKLSIPISNEFGPAYTLGHSLMMGLNGKRYANDDMRRSKAMLRFMNRVVQAMWAPASLADPTEVEAGATARYGMHMVTPTALVPGLELAGNENVFGGDIVKGLYKGKPPKNVPLYAHRKGEVSPLAASMSQGGHDALGLNVAPEISQYMIDQALKQQIDLIHSLPEVLQFANGLFGPPKKDAETGKERPGVFKRAFFQESHPLSYRSDLQELIDYEISKSHDAGDKQTPKLNLLKQGQNRAAALAKAKKYKAAEEVQRNTLKRYNEMKNEF
jgi:hypothetical protein